MKNIGVIILIMIVFTSCKKEEHITVLQKSSQNTYVFDNLIGNAKIIIYNTENSYSISVINGPGSIIGCAIRNYNNLSTVYFSDSYISRGDTETQTGAMLGIPTGTYLELQIVVYKSTVSSALYRSIEMLGLDFWNNINSYKESIAEEYVTVFMLQE